MLSEEAIAAVVQRRDDVRYPRRWYLEEVLGDGARRPLRLDEPVANGVEYELHLKPVHDINMTRTHNSSFGFTLTEV
jgi:hypothetical protein